MTRKTLPPEWFVGFKPMLCKGTKSLRNVPENFLVEPKIDGRRFLAIKKDGKVTFRSRQGTDRTENVLHLKSALENLPGDFVLDGEMVVFADDAETLECHGQDVRTPSFTLCANMMGSKGGRSNALQRRLGIRPTFVVFDVPAFGGEDLTTWPLSQRVKLLDQIVETVGSEHFIASPRWSMEHVDDVEECVAKTYGEGLVFKNPAAPYRRRGKRTNEWLKYKFVVTTDVVLMGFKNGQGKYADEAGAFRFGQYKDGVLVERGKCSGMTDSIRFAVSDADLGRVFEIKGFQPVPGSDSVRMPQFLRWRDADDKVASDCQWDAF